MNKIIKCPECKADETYIEEIFVDTNQHKKIITFKCKICLHTWNIDVFY